MKKILITSIIILIVLVLTNFVTQHGYIPFVNELYGQLFLSVFKKDGKPVTGVIDNNNLSVVASKNTPYIIVYFSDKSIGILNSSNDQLKMLGEKSANLPVYPFSSDGNKLVYSTVRAEMGIPGSDNANYTFYYYYDLYLYDIVSGQSKIITDKSQNFLLNIYAGSRYGWLDDHTVGYNCDLNQTYGPQKTCAYDIKTGDTKILLASPIFNANGSNTLNIPTGSDFMINNCFYDFQKQNCAYGVLRFKVYDSMLFQDIWLKMPSKKLLLYRGRPRVSSLYWTSDNHLYGIFQDKLLKLF